MRYDMVLDRIKDSPLGPNVPFTELSQKCSICGRYYEVKIRLQGCLIDILITKIDTSTSQGIHRNKWQICQKLLPPLQMMLKVEVIKGVEIHQVFYKNPIKA
jgi:hypothetical protein